MSLRDKYTDEEWDNLEKEASKKNFEHGFMKNKDWTGNRNSVFKTLGDSNHTEKERKNEDYYATDSIASELLLELEEFNGDGILDNSVGGGNLLKPFIDRGFKVKGVDIIDRGFPNTIIKDFISEKAPESSMNWDIVFNPPYKHAYEFIEQSIRLVKDGRKVCAFLKLQFLEGKKRKELFKKYPPKTIWVSSSRILCAKNADFDGMRAGGGSAVAYAWFVWEKGYKGETIIKWFN